MLESSLAGLIAAIVALVGRWLIVIVTERRRERHDSLAVCRSYADPISRAAARLFWRLREMTVADRAASYFSEPRTNFEEYKYNSTLYRICETVGWLRAYRLELNYFPIDARELKSVTGAIESFESALSEGAHVELERARRVCKALGISDLDEGELKTKALDAERALKHALQLEGVELATDLRGRRRRDLCKEVASTLSYESELSDEQCESVVSALAIREAWLYRDYQDGLGDLMLRPVSRGSRRFDVIGFAEFERFLRTKDADQKIWVSRVQGLVDELDVGGGGQSDARTEMFRMTLTATGGLLETLAELNSDRRAALETTLREVEDLRCRFGPVPEGSQTETAEAR